MPPPILLMKLMTASLPMALMGGTCRPKMSSGRSKAPPPIPVNPTRVPTMNPIPILSRIRGMVVPAATAALCGTDELADADESFALQVKNNFLRRFFRREVRGVDHDIGIGGGLVRIGNSGELLH